MNKLRKVAIRRWTDMGTLVWSDPSEPPLEDFVCRDNCPVLDARLEALIREPQNIATKNTERPSEAKNKRASKRRKPTQGNQDDQGRFCLES